MTRLDDACRAAKLEPVPWSDAQIGASWDAIEVGRQRRVRTRQAMQAGAAIALAVCVGTWWWLTSPTAPAHTVPPVASATQPRRLEDASAQARSPAPEDPTTQQADPGSATLQGNAQLAHREGRRVYNADDSWTGSVRAGVDIEISGEGTSFEVESLPDAYRVTATASVVVVKYAGQRIELEGGESVRLEVESTRIGPSKKSRPMGRKPSAQTLLGEADAARVRGDLGAAATALKSFVSTYPRHADVGNAWFQLGKVERRRGRHRAAARAFAQSRPHLQGGALESDALASQARSLASAKKSKDAKTLAGEYLRKFPRGVHAAAMRSIAETP
ncbi:MAG: tetratricopeptide repeat protein [Nannocystales bacterium]